MKVYCKKKVWFFTHFNTGLDSVLIIFLMIEYVVLYSHTYVRYSSLFEILPVLRIVRRFFSRSRVAEQAVYKGNNVHVGQVFVFFIFLLCRRYISLY